MPLPLPVRKNIRDSEPKLKEALERIQKATDKEWTFEVDWEKNFSQIEASQQTSIGSIYQDEVMSNVAYCLEKACADPLTKESLNEATPNNKITIRVNEKANGYWQYKFENGDLILEHKKSICNTSDVSYADLAKFIPSQSGALSLVIRKDIESVREQQQELLQNIANYTGSGEWILEVDWNAVVSKLEGSQKDNVGSIYIGEVLKNVAYLLENKLKNETLKEAFNEATSARTITIQPNDKIKSYWDMSIKDGGLLVQHKPSICNTSDVSYYDLPSIIPIPGSLNLIAKLNLEEEKNKEKYQEAMEQIKTAAGEEFTFDESCIAPLYEKLGSDNKSQQNNIGDLVYGEILPNIARNIENRLKDEMVKEAFMEICSAKTITIAADPKQKSYWDWKFQNGGIVVTCKPPMCNTSDVTYFDFEKLL